MNENRISRSKMRAFFNRVSDQQLECILESDVAINMRVLFTQNANLFLQSAVAIDGTSHFDS